MEAGGEKGGGEGTAVASAEEEEEEEEYHVTTEMIQDVHSRHDAISSVIGVDF